MSYKKVETKFFEKSYEWRNKYYGPMLKFLHKKGVTADHITYARALVFIVGVMYPLFVTGNILLATIIYFFGFWLLDTLDGAVARYAKKDSDRGKFNDILIDIMGYSIFVMGIAFLGFSSVFIMFYNVIIHGALWVIAIALHNENEKSDWVIRPESNLSYFKIIAHIFVAAFVLFGVNWLDAVYGLLNVWMTITFIIKYVQFQNQKYTKN